MLKRKKFIKGAEYILWGICFLAALWRVKYGIELTDESIYLAGGAMYAKGALPFVDIWSHMAPSAFTYGFLVKM